MSNSENRTLLSCILVEVEKDVEYVWGRKKLEVSALFFNEGTVLRACACVTLRDEGSSSICHFFIISNAAQGFHCPRRLLISFSKQRATIIMAEQKTQEINQDDSTVGAG